MIHRYSRRYNSVQRPGFAGTIRIDYYNCGSNTTCFVSFSHFSATGTAVQRFLPYYFFILHFVFVLQCFFHGIAPVRCVDGAPRGRAVRVPMPIRSARDAIDTVVR